jgi:hypothetical protein
MPWAVEDLHATVSVFALTTCLITTLIASTPAQARTRAMFIRNKQTPTRSTPAHAIRARAGTSLRARHIFRSRHATTYVPFSYAVQVYVGRLRVTRCLRSAYSIVHPGFVPLNPHAGTGASSVTPLPAVPDTSTPPRIPRPWPCLGARALHLPPEFQAPALRAAALSIFLSRLNSQLRRGTCALRLSKAGRHPRTAYTTLTAARQWTAAAPTPPTPRARPSSVLEWNHPRANA